MIRAHPLSPSLLSFLATLSTQLPPTGQFKQNETKQNKNYFLFIVFPPTDPIFSYCHNSVEGKEQWQRKGRNEVHAIHLDHHLPITIYFCCQCLLPQRTISTFLNVSRTWIIPSNFIYADCHVNIIPV